MESLHRIVEHLPNTTLEDPFSRITVDTDGRIWMADDTTLVILKGHLIIEAALIDICQRALRKPEVLEKTKVSFHMRLTFVRALIGDDVPECIWLALGDLNSIRNKLAHNLEPKDIEANLQQFLHRLDEIEDYQALHDEKAPLPKQLVGCLTVLAGALSNVGDSKCPSANMLSHLNQM